jgi:hypothetical protein
MLGRWELLHTVVCSVCRTGMAGMAAPSVCQNWRAAAPGLTSLVPPRRMTLQLHSPRMTRSCRRLLRLVLTVLHMHSRTRRGTYADGLGLEGEDQESARTGTGGVDTPNSMDSVYLNCFLSYYFIFNGLMYHTIVIFGFYVAKRYRLTIFIRVLDTVIFFVKLN